MSEELKRPFCGGTASIAYYRTGNNVLLCQDCQKAFSEVEAKIMKQAARIAELEAERDRLRKALEKIAQWDMLARSQKGLIAIIDVLKDAARKALEGIGE